MMVVRTRRKHKSWLASGWRRMSGCERGATAVEFALVLPALLSFILGSVEFGRAMWVRNTLQYATEEAARYVITNQAATAVQIEAKVESNAVGLSAADVIVTSATAVIGSVSYLTITATFNFSFLGYGDHFGAGFTLEGKSRIPLT